MRLRAPAAAWVLVAACSRPGGAARGDAAPPAAPVAEPSSAPVVSSTRPEVTPSPEVAASPRVDGSAAAAVITAGEPRRSTVARLEDEPTLRPIGGALREHFGSGSRGPYDVQRIDVPGSRLGALVARADGSAPIVVVAERDTLLWSKPHPTWGMVAPARLLTIAARPDGGVVLFAWIEPLHTVAARMWADDGNAFGDFEVFAPDACDAITAARGPAGQGWVIACAAAGGTRAQHLREEGTSGWGAGARVGSGSAAGAVALAFDSASSLVMLERSMAVGGDRLLAFRYALADGSPLWESPIDLGVVSGPRSQSGRAATVIGGDGVVHVAPVRGVATLRDRGIAIASDGRVAR